MIRLFFALFLVVPIVSGNAAPVHTAPAIVRSENVVPFVSGEMERAGERVGISWKAPGAGAVNLVASRDPDRLIESQLLGQGGEAGSIDILLPLRPDGRRWFVHLVPTRGAALVLAERSFNLPTAPNFRDLGGYRTSDGRWVRMGMLFRSDQLNLLSDKDLARIAATGVGTVADLRTSAERTREPDRVPEGARHMIFDMAGEQDPAPFMAALARGEGREAMVDIYRQFPSSAATAVALKGLLSTAIETNAPMLFHCTAGKDRTGWASAVLLSLLGVPREMVITDYLNSVSLLNAKNAKILANVQPPFTAEQLLPVLSVERAFIDASFDATERRYGSMETYAKEALGLDSAAIERLRERYLAGTPTG